MSMPNIIDALHKPNIPKIDWDFLGIRKREMINASKRVSEAFDIKNITEKENKGLLDNLKKSMGFKT